MIDNLPLNPQIGDQHTARNGIIYTYDGTKWRGLVQTITTSQSVSNGANGEKGPPGPKGEKGDQGPAGQGIGNTTVQNTITLGSTGTQPVTGTRTIQRIESQVIGDKVILTYKLGFAGGQAGTGDYLLSLPTGLQFNTTYNPATMSALWTGDVHGMAPYTIAALGGIVIPGWWSNQIFVVPYDSTRFRIALTGNGDQTKFSYWCHGFYFVGSNTMLNLRFEIWK